MEDVCVPPSLKIFLLNMKIYLIIPGTFNNLLYAKKAISFYKYLKRVYFWYWFLSSFRNSIIRVVFNGSEFYNSCVFWMTLSRQSIFYSSLIFSFPAVFLSIESISGFCFNANISKIEVSLGMSRVSAGLLTYY